MPVRTTVYGVIHFPVVIDRAAQDALTVFPGNSEIHPSPARHQTTFIMHHGHRRRLHVVHGGVVVIVGRDCTRLRLHHQSCPQAEVKVDCVRQILQYSCNRERPPLALDVGLLRSGLCDKGLQIKAGRQANLGQGPLRGPGLVQVQANVGDQCLAYFEFGPVVAHFDVHHALAGRR